MTKQYLSVSYEDRELAKRLGARWDPSVQRWYCTKGSALAKIFGWRAAPKTGAKASCAAAQRMAQNNIATRKIVTKTARQNKNGLSHGHKTDNRDTNSHQPIAQNQNFELFLAG